MAVEVVRRALALLLLAATFNAAAQTAPRADLLATCIACHGPGGNSQLTDTPAIAAQPKLFIENQLVLIREGLRDIPAMTALMKGVGDEEISALSRYFAEQPLQAAASAPRPAQRERGAELSRQALCGTCHLPKYQGQNQVPRLAGQHEAYLVYSLKQFRDNPGPGRDTIMASTLRGMSDQNLQDLAHYFAVARP